MGPDARLGFGDSDCDCCSRNRSGPASTCSYDESQRADPDAASPSAAGCSVMSLFIGEVEITDAFSAWADRGMRSAVVGVAGILSCDLSDLGAPGGIEN